MPARERVRVNAEIDDRLQYVFASSGDGGPLPCFTDGYVASVVG
jgi:hypothetical protein